MTKNAERREKFRLAAEHLPNIGDPNVPDYFTGRESKFKMRRGNSANENGLKRTAFGPKFKTPQWERTLR